MEDDELVRRRIKRALTPEAPFPDHTLLDRSLSRLPGRGASPRATGQWLIAPLAILLTAAAVITLLTARALLVSAPPAPAGPLGLGPQQGVPNANVPPPTLTRAGNVVGYTFVSATTGWLLEDSADGRIRVLRTADGGGTWAAAGVPGSAAPSLSILRALDDQRALVIETPDVGLPGARIWSTADAGAHWQQ